MRACTHSHTHTHIEPHLGGLKACWAVFWDDWQLARLSKIPQVLLSDVCKWSDHPQVVLPVGEARKSTSNNSVKLKGKWKVQGKEWCKARYESQYNMCKINILDSVVSFHGAQSAIVEHRHHEALSQVIQVLPKCQHIAVVPSCCCIQPPSLHAGTKATDGVQVWKFCCLTQDVWRGNKAHKKRTSNFTIAHKYLQYTKSPNTQGSTDMTHPHQVTPG